MDILYSKQTWNELDEQSISKILFIKKTYLIRKNWWRFIIKFLFTVIENYEKICFRIFYYFSIDPTIPNLYLKLLYIIIVTFIT